MSILFETNKGIIRINLNYKKFPVECENFVKLCYIDFYKYSIFGNLHKDSFVDVFDPLYPLRKEGSSIWGFTVENQTSASRLKYNKERQVCNKQRQYFKPSKILSSAETGDVGYVVTEGMVASNIRIALDDGESNDFCPFGKIFEGFDTLLEINSSIVDDNKQPVEDIRIKTIHILHDEGILSQFRFKKLEIPFPKSLYSTARLPISTEIDVDEIKEADAKSQALTLEMIGDLPRSDVKPKETTLFVCKLNPVTVDDDLRLIFSKFGEIVSCDIVKDKQTGNSLCYAFIDFKHKKSCEDAYFKMQGVLIDDRRIHVDFSQSVWRLQRRKRQKRYPH